MPLDIAKSLPFPFAASGCHASTDGTVISVPAPEASTATSDFAALLLVVPGMRLDPGDTIPSRVPVKKNPSEGESDRTPNWFGLAPPPVSALPLLPADGSGPSLEMGSTLVPDHRVDLISSLKAPDATNGSSTSLTAASDDIPSDSMDSGEAFTSPAPAPIDPLAVATGTASQFIGALDSPRPSVTEVPIQDHVGEKSTPWNYGYAPSPNTEPLADVRYRLTEEAANIPLAISTENDASLHPADSALRAGLLTTPPLDPKGSKSLAAGPDREKASDGVHALPSAPAQQATSESSDPIARIEAPHEPRPIAAQIQDRFEGHLEELRDTGQLNFQMDIHPPELGRMQLHVSLDDGKLSVHVIVANEAAKQALDQQFEPLRDRFAEMGLTLGQFDVRRDGGSSRQDSPADLVAPEWDNTPQPRNSARLRYQYLPLPGPQSRLDVLV